MNAREKRLTGPASIKRGADWHFEGPAGKYVAPQKE